MSCVFKHKESKINTLSELKEQGILDGPYLKDDKETEFNNYHNNLIESVQENYNLGIDKFFNILEQKTSSVFDIVKKFVQPIDNSFKQLDQARKDLGIYDTKESYLSFKEAAAAKSIKLNEVTNVKPGVQELFDSNPELANQVYEAIGFRTPNITVLPNGNLKIVAFRTEKAGPTSKGEYQRGKGLYLSLDRPYPGEDVYTVEIEISPKNLLDRKLGFGKISEDFFIDEKNKRVDKQLDTLAEFKQSLGIKAEIGSIDGALMNELVLFDKDLINQALNSKQQYNPQQKQQALQLYSQYLDTGKQDIEGFKQFVATQPSTPITAPTSTKQEQLVQRNMSNMVSTSLTESDALSNNKATLKTEIIAMSKPKNIKGNLTSDLKIKLGSLIFKSDPIVTRFARENKGILSSFEYTPEKIKDAFLTFVDKLTNEEAVQLRKALCS
jgi:hypothetical protein